LSCSAQRARRPAFEQRGRPLASKCEFLLPRATRARSSPLYFLRPFSVVELGLGHSSLKPAALALAARAALLAILRGGVDLSRALTEAPDLYARRFSSPRCRPHPRPFRRRRSRSRACARR
jgi:hypothetical protein